ncbi:hypothetical protein SCLCIDRAFT_142755 [Scleroderma citrinum Foug A]|uniref:Uncharacterized protein n=1 Tax=Scleroderma citrinum Foug A TaxID=1036808 RepID=A0A0C2YPN0_9AGAM|nr:hypothetical protein SCLCIDRAFT_142755 [Scleroderma citrinum Foug A]
MDSGLLHPRSGVQGDDSPSSSVFDLPVQPSNPQTAVTAQLKTTQVKPGNDSNGDYSPQIVVISGGSGGNSICSAFDNACFVLPVSDDGGSSSEIIRVLGGPSIGDIRSRLVRLIPRAPPSSPLGALHTLLSYRLPVNVSEREARTEWRDIVEGNSHLWTGIPNDRKETIRGFLVYFEGEVLKRAHKNFSFLNGSIGNYFLSGAQMFFRSLPSAIFLFASITNSQANILPVIITNHTVTIAAELENGSRLVGQCEISHPLNQPSSFEEDLDEQITGSICSPVDDMGGTIPHRSNVMYSQADKDLGYEPLKSRICRLYYINAYGHEVHPTPNPEYIKHLSTSEALVYSCGSLWTSIVPCLALRCVASAIARSNCLRAKIFLLNGMNDRETDGYTAVDYVRTIATILNTHYQKPPYGLGNVQTIFPISAFVTHLVYLEGTSVVLDENELTNLGVMCVKVRGVNGVDQHPRYDSNVVRQAVDQILDQSFGLWTLTPDQ